MEIKTTSDALVLIPKSGDDYFKLGRIVVGCTHSLTYVDDKIVSVKISINDLLEKLMK